MAKIIGIDFGNTNCCVAIMEGGSPQIIPNVEGARTTPSVVGFNLKTGDLVVGEPAKRQVVLHPDSTVTSIKRFMGLAFADWGNEPMSKPYLMDSRESGAFANASADLPTFGFDRETRPVPYLVERSGNGGCLVRVMDQSYTPEQISAMILLKLKVSAESYLGMKITQAVITVPSNFNNVQRQATKDAASIAGLEVLQVISESTAAALAYSLKKKDGNIAVFDFGGGGFSISIVEVSEGVVEVKATDGDTHLGGEDVDQIIVDWLVEEFQRQEGVDLRLHTDAMQRLQEAAEIAKCLLSTTTEADIKLPYIVADASGPKHINQFLTRVQFEAMLEPILQQLQVTSLNALKSSRLSPQEIGEVLLVGGSTRIPRVQGLVKAIFGREPYKGVNPDEVVALGAAVQGGIFAGDCKGFLLLDATPFSLGINANGGEMNVIVPRHTTIPTKRSEIFTTATDSQCGVEIEVFQGENPVAGRNKLLGKLHLGGLMPAPCGVSEIEVTFDIGRSRTIVTAKDKKTDKQASLVLTNSSDLTRDHDEI